MAMLWQFYGNVMAILWQFMAIYGNLWQFMVIEGLILTDLHV